jgi:hypothetical protein
MRADVAHEAFLGTMRGLLTIPLMAKGTFLLMKPSLCLWRQWSAQLRELLPEVHGHRTKTLAFFVLGLVLAGSARLPRIAEEWLANSAAKTPSIERRLARFLANDQVETRALWTALLSQFLRGWQGSRLFFVLDCTPLDDRACVVYLGLLVHSRLLPVGWQVMPLQETWDQGKSGHCQRLIGSGHCTSRPG